VPDTRGPTARFHLVPAGQRLRRRERVRRSGYGPPCGRGQPSTPEQQQIPAPSANGRTRPYGPQDYGGQAGYKLVRATSGTLRGDQYVRGPIRASTLRHTQYCAEPPCADPYGRSHPPRAVRRRRWPGQYGGYDETDHSHEPTPPDTDRGGGARRVFVRLEPAEHGDYLAGCSRRPPWMGSKAGFLPHGQTWPSRTVRGLHLLLALEQAATISPLFALGCLLGHPHPVAVAISRRLAWQITLTSTEQVPSPTISPR